MSKAFIDARCKCGVRLGWYGVMADRPVCHRCGYRPPQEELDEATNRMAEFINRTSTPIERQHQEVWRQIRLDAGLNLRPASELLGITATKLSAIETGREPLDNRLAMKMNEVYGITPAKKR